MIKHVSMLVFGVFVTFIASINAAENPVIGVLAQETFILHNANPTETSYIAASYVKFLESAGARVVPIWRGQNRDYYEKVVQYTNGVLLPGGGTFFDEPNGYGTAAKKIYDLAIDTNKNGTYFPIFGICLGMQVLFYASMGGYDIRQICSATNIPLNLDFTSDYRKSRMFASTTDHIINNLKKQKLTFNFHTFCILEKVLQEKNLLKYWHILSTSVDKRGTEFISAIENREYPFYGLQFHPEKNMYEFKETLKIPHGKEAVEISQYFANLFVEEARKNNNTFPNKDLLEKSLMYNYNPVFSERNTAFEQIYLFKNTENKINVFT